MKKKLIIKCFIFTSLIISAIPCFAAWGWTNIAEDICNKPNFKVIQVYDGQQFSIKWDRFEHGAFIAGDAIVRFRNITDYNDIVGVLNNYPDTQGLKITGTNWVYANVFKSGTIIVYAPFSSEITFTPDIFLSDKSSVSAWEIISPDITNSYRIKSFFSNSKGTNPFPNYFNDLSLKDKEPINYGKLKEFDNLQAYVAGVNVDCDFISSGKEVNFAPYSIGTLNKYYFYIWEKTKTAYDRIFSNPALTMNEDTFGLKSSMAVFMISDKAYIDNPINVYPPDTGHYYEVDNPYDIKDCHFWSYAKTFNSAKYQEIQNYKGYDALFPIGLMKFNTFRFAYPQHLTPEDHKTKKCVDFGTSFYNPVNGQQEMQSLEDGFLEYIYADRLTPAAR